MKKLKFLGILMALVLVFTAMSDYVPAKAGEYLTVLNNGDDTIAVEPGRTNHVRVGVKSLVRIDSLTGLKAGVDSSAPFTISDLKLLDGSNNSYTSGRNLNVNDVAYLEFDITVKETAKIGTYPISIKGKMSGWDDMTGDVVYVTEEILALDIFVPTELSPVMLSVKNVTYDKDQVMPGNTFNLKLDVTNEGETKALNTYVSLSLPEGMDPGYSVDLHKLGDIGTGAISSVSFPINVLASCKTGQQPITVTFTCKDAAGKDVDPVSKLIYVNVKELGKIDNAPFVTVSTADNYKQLKLNSDDEINLKVKNEGDALAKNVKVKVIAGFGTDTGITKSYTSEYINVGSIEPGKTSKVKVPFIVGKKLSGDLIEIQFQVDYTGSDDATVRSNIMSMYVTGPEELTQDTTVRNIINITNVSQNPANPAAGGRVSVTFKVNNDGTHPIKDFRIAGANLGKNNFEPLTSEPYTYVGDIANGSSKVVTLTFGVGEEIAEGLNVLSLDYKYLDANNEVKTESTGVYVLNVSNETGNAMGTPKLIIDSWTTKTPEGETIHAGDTFDLTFSLRNTHANKAAKNIKVTVSQAEGIFAAAQGSNMFYVDKIDAGQSSENSITLKCKSTTATGDYDLNIKFEYEYDDMNDADKERGGVSADNPLKIHAVENYRPKIENVNVEAYEGVYVGSEVNLNFEFYNMGQSRLSNVFVTIEGDFELANNSEMSYVGTIEAGGQEFVSPAIVPLHEGDCQGTLVVHFEDSNGDEVTTTSTFNAYAEDPSSSYGGPSEYEPGEGEDIGGYEEEAEPIMPVWVFVAIICGILLIGTLVTYKAIIAKKRKQLQKEADEAE